MRIENDSFVRVLRAVWDHHGCERDRTGGQSGSCDSARLSAILALDRREVARHIDEGVRRGLLMGAVREGLAQEFVSLRLTKLGVELVRR